jgi:membrane associated rhomboid family serine protease
MDPGYPAPPPPPPPPSPVDDRCYRHPDVPTGVHCTRCGRAICTDCMRPAAVGHQCPECARETRQEFMRPGQRVGTRAGGRSATVILLGALVLVYIAEVVVGGPGSLVSGPDGLTLVKMGASIGVAQLPSGELVGIATGEYWRMITATFLHVGIFHLLMNGYALYIFGSVLEAEEGSVRFLTIYAVTALAASAASYAFGDPLVPSAGASGAIFGLFGAFLGTAWVKRDNPYYAARVRNAAWLIVVNAFIAFSVSGIDWRAHLGGLVAGIVLGVVAALRRTTSSLFLIACAAVLAVSVGLTVWRTAELTTRFSL